MTGVREIQTKQLIASQQAQITRLSGELGRTRLALDEARRAKRKNTLRAVRPNVGIEREYQRRLLREIDAMCRSVGAWLSKVYRAHPPEIAQDEPVVKIEALEVPAAGGKLRWQVYVDGEPLQNKHGNPRQFASQAAAVRAAKVELGMYLPAAELNAAVDEMAAVWQGRFDALAPKLARHFATKVGQRSDAALQTALKQSGIAIDFQVTPAMADIMEATVSANVDLIKSIPQRYLENVRGEVMRSVQTGRDLEQLTKYLTEQLGVTQRRAELIALDQNNKATSALARARQLEIGVQEGIWQHSHAGREPRPTHVRMDGKRFNVAEGMYDPDPKVRRHIMPGELINCRCTWRAVLPGFD